MSSRFHVDVARARTPEASFYTDADGYAREVGRVFGKSWQLVRAPEMDDVADFDPTRIQLEPVRVESRGPLLFVTLDTHIPSVPEYFPHLGADCAPYGVEKMRYVTSRTYPVNANWKVYVDNFLEGYHIPLVHPALNRELDYRRDVTTLREHHVMQFCLIREHGAEHYRTSPGGPPAGYFWLYPNMMLNHE